MYRHLKILGIIAAALLFLYIALLIVGKRGSAKTVSSALLNEKYAAEVSLVRVTVPVGWQTGADSPQTAGKIEARRADQLWVFNPQADITAPVATSRMRELLDAAARVRKMSVFADTPKNREDLSLTPGKAVQVDFEAETGLVFSSLSFGSEDFTRRNISLRSAKSADTGQRIDLK